MSRKQDIVKSPEELIRSFRMRFSSLQLAMKNYDEGHMSEAQTLATHIHTFVHDGGKKQPSLLGLIKKKSILFENTGRKIDGKNLASDLTLCIMNIGPNGLKYIPSLGEGPEKYPDMRFSKWWEAIIFKDGQKNKISLSRKNVIFGMRNQAGGGHLSKCWDRDFALLSRDNPAGWISSVNGEQSVPEYGPEYASVRQIAYELDVTLRKNYSDLLFD